MASAASCRRREAVRPRRETSPTTAARALLAQAFLDERQDVPLAAGLGIDDPVRVQASAQEARSEEIPPGQAPEHRTLEAGRNPGGEERRAAGELGGEPRFDHLVQRAPGEAASPAGDHQGYEH